MGEAETQILTSYPADTDGYTHVVVHPRVGSTQSSQPVVCKVEDGEATIHVHGQREFDVPTGAEVHFPDGTVWQA